MTKTTAPRPMARLTATQQRLAVKRTRLKALDTSLETGLRPEMNQNTPTGKNSAYEEFDECGKGLETAERATTSETP